MPTNPLVPASGQSRSGNPLLFQARLASTGTGFYSFSRTEPLISWGEGTPSGTPETLFYINTTATDAAATLYCGASGTWEAMNQTSQSWYCPAGTSAASVQTALDANGFVLLGPGNHTWTTQITIGDFQEVVGCGLATLVRWNAAGAYAIDFGTGATGVGSRCGNFQLASANASLYLGGGINISKCAAPSTLHDMYINRAKEHGLNFDAACFGESLFVKNVVVTESVKDGLHIEQGAGLALNLITFEDCHFKTNLEYGINVTPTTTGSLEALKFINCECQGNGRGRLANGSFTAGTFQDAEVATQATTGATARIVGTQSAGTTLKGGLLTGTPNGTSVWTGGTSGATFTPTSQAGFPSDCKLAGDVNAFFYGCWWEPFSVASTLYTKAGVRLESNGTEDCGATYFVNGCRFSLYTPWTTSNNAAILAIATKRPPVIDDCNVSPYNATPDSGSTVRYKLNQGKNVPIGLKRNINATDSTDLNAAGPLTYKLDWIVFDNTIT